MSTNVLGNKSNRQVLILELSLAENTRSPIDQAHLGKCQILLHIIDGMRKQDDS